MIAPVAVPVRRDPPARSNAVVTDEAMAAVRADPGNWYLIARRPGHPTYLRHVKRPANVELRLRFLTDDNGARYTEVYARCRP